MNKELFNDGEYRIEINLSTNEYEVAQKTEDNFDVLKSFKIYSDAEKYIDGRRERISKGIIKKKEPLNCLLEDYNSRIKTAKITSISLGEKYGLYLWISLNGKRSKENCSRLYKDTENNKNIFKEIENLKDKLGELEKTKEHFTEKELKEYFGGEE